MRSLSTILFASVIFAFASCKKQDVIEPKSTLQPDATGYSSKVATDWMHTLEKVVQSEAKNPPQASRIYAYASIGLYESVLPGMHGYQSLQGQVADLTNLPQASNFNALNYTVSSNEAMYQVSIKIFGALKPENTALLEALHTKYLNETLATAGKETTNESVAFGKLVASAILDRANNDNFAATRNLAYLVPSASVNAAYWSPTNAVVTPLEPYWGKIKCFGMSSSSACAVNSKIAFSTTEGSAFYKQANEVLTIGTHLTADQKAIAYWWSDGTAQTATPPGHWVAIADQVAAQKSLNLGKAAEMYVMLNMTMADAFISCWDAKYKLNLLRPLSYVRSFIPGGSSWTPLLTTPPFPEYPSGHSVASAAACEVLTNILGTFSFTDTANVYLGYAPRNYVSFVHAANEAAISRLYGGIHYREAIENGMMQGMEVSKAVMDKIKLLKP